MEQFDEYDLVIVGASVSGTFAALNINEKIRTLLIDRDSNILMKFMIAGNGKSNITNTLATNKFLMNLIGANKFMYPSLTKHNSLGFYHY